MMTPNTVSTNSIPDDRDPVSIWRVCLPPDCDRSDYIDTCYLTGTVIVENENGEQTKARIGKLALQLVIFPLTEGAYGSEVSCLSYPYGSAMYVADVYAMTNEFIYQKENQYRLEKHTNIGRAELFIDGNGNISLSVDSEQENGIITLNITNKQRSGKLNIVVNGNINIQNDGEILAKTTGQVLFDSPKILLNDGNEPVLLGQKTVDLIKNILDQLSTESAGPYPLRNATKYAEIAQKLDELKSELTFLK